MRVHTFTSLCSTAGRFWQMSWMLRRATYCISDSPDIRVTRGGPRFRKYNLIWTQLEVIVQSEHSQVGHWSSKRWSVFNLISMWSRTISIYMEMEENINNWDSNRDDIFDCDRNGDVHFQFESEQNRIFRRTWIVMSIFTSCSKWGIESTEDIEWW